MVVFKVNRLWKAVVLSGGRDLCEQLSPGKTHIKGRSLIQTADGNENCCNHAAVPHRVMVLCCNKMSFTNFVQRFTFNKKCVIKFLKGYTQYVRDINNMKPNNLQNNCIFFHEAKYNISN